MADSEITTRLFSVTRRGLLAGSAISAAGWGFGRDATTGTWREGAAFDPVPGIWRAWDAACAETDALCLRQQGLEKQLAEAVSVGFYGDDIGAREGCDPKSALLMAVEFSNFVNNFVQFYGYQFQLR